MAASPFSQERLRLFSDPHCNDPDDDLALFIGSNVDAFYPLVRPEQRFSLCWQSIILPLPWFLYRKMYGLTGLAVLVPIALSLLFSASLLSQYIVAIAIVLGVPGKMLYLRHAKKLIILIRAATPDEAEARALIAQAGGVSRAGMGIGIALTIAAIVAPLLIYSFTKAA